MPATGVFSWGRSNFRFPQFQETTETKGEAMNWDQVAGNWKQVKGKAREQWGKLTDDDLDVVAGRRDQLIGVLQERYGWARNEAEKQADSFAKALKESKAAHR
jgi:uncharacterized protein YjbJ (UPF0337 family)